jgi:hypothetical protein
MIGGLAVIVACPSSSQKLGYTQASCTFQIRSKPNLIQIKSQSKESIMNNKMKTVLLASVTLALSACGGDGKDKTPEVTGAAAFVEGTHPRFNPVASDIPFNTDLIFAAAATTDGTANVGEATDAVRATLNALDGFSTSAFFDVMISGGVDAATAIPMQTVFLLELDAGGKDALNPANIVGIKGAASFDVKVVSLDGGTNNVIRVRPTSPLKAKAKYLVFLTNGIKDAAGQPLTRSWTYNALHDSDYATLDSLVPVRNAILGWEKLAAGFLTATNSGLSASAAVDKLVLSYTFTTTDPQAPLVAMAAPRAALAASQIAAGVPAATAVGAVSLLEAGGLLSTPKARSVKVSPLSGVDFTVLSAGALVGNVGKLYTGSIKLPYYQTAGSSTSFTYLTKNWAPDRVLAEKLNVTVPADVNGSYNTTYRYPFAAKTGDEVVPLQITLPQKTLVPGYAASANCGQIYGASGYPVVIYIHGITSDRSSVLALGHTLASKCIATVAIDLPVHGVAASNPLAAVLNVDHSQQIPFAALYNEDKPHERHFDVAGEAGAPAAMDYVAKTGGSGVHFTNLGYLLNTRDNNRQAVMDLLNLNASLKNINSSDLMVAEGMQLNLANVNVVGISLGGILGSVFTTVNQVAIASEAKVGLTSNLNPIKSIVASTAGSQVSQVLVNSASFGPVINAGLQKAGVNVGTSNYEKFMYAAQSAVDVADPVNFAPLLATLNVPVLLQQVKDDAVIPNRADSAPLAGTEALARLLGTTQLGLGETQLGRGFVKLNAGDHVSLLRPAAAAPQVTAEMQAQVVSFVLNGAKVAVGSQAPADIVTP